jgi:hypothetical protein
VLVPEPRSLPRGGKDRGVGQVDRPTTAAAGARRRPLRLAAAGWLMMAMQPYNCSDLSPALLIGRERGLAFGWASQQAEFSHCWKLPASSPEYGARSIRAGAVRQITRGIAGATATGFRRLQASATAAAGFYSRQILLRAPLAAARLEPASSQTVAIW